MTLSTTVASSTPSPAPLSVDTVQEIVALPDTTLRNLRVTLGYYDLSCRIARTLGYDNANWCTFAVWASRYAGVFVRGDIPVAKYLFQYLQQEANPADRVVLDAAAKFAAANPNGALDQQAIENLSSRLRAQWLNRLVAKAYSGPAGLTALVGLVFAAFGQATSHGNTRVFHDIASTFLPFLELLEKASSADDEPLARFLRRLSPYPARLGGQLELRKALEHYTKAKFEKDPAQRSRLMFVANGFVGCHEQTRLQEEIPLALNAPIDTLQEEVVKIWTDMVWRHAQRDLGERFAWSRPGWRIDRLVRLSVIPGATAAASVLWGLFATRWMMALPLPDETLDLGSDLPPLPDGSGFPESLADAALEQAGFGDFVHFISFAYRGSLRGTAASDWTSYTERMNTIANLFRSRQQRPSLFRPPFTPAQIELLRKPKNFQIPSGSLGGEAPPFTADGLRELRAHQSP